MIITESVPETQLNCRLTCLDAILGKHNPRWSPGCARLFRITRPSYTQPVSSAAMASAASA